MSFNYGGTSVRQEEHFDETEIAAKAERSYLSKESWPKIEPCKRKKKESSAFLINDEDCDNDGENKSKEYMRAPNDPRPFDGYDKSDVASEGVCFPSQFVPDVPEGMSDMASEDIKTAYGRIERMIKENYANNMATKDLVNNVQKFYDEQIRANYPDMPPWSKKSIYNYIFFNSESEDAEERQANESIRAIYHQLDFLRSHSVSRSSSSGHIMPEYKNVKLMCDLAKTHAQLVSAKKQRRK
jgi:hypothetical protein